VTYHIERITSGTWKEHCYIVSSDDRNALVIDPGAGFAEIDAYLISKSLKPLAIVNTHAHYDHVGSVAPLKEKYQIPFLLHSLDEKLLSQANFYRNIFGGKEMIAIPKVDERLDSRTHAWTFEEFKVEAIFSPGHTLGGVCLQLDDCLFTGDTLFHGKIGSTLLPGGNRPQLLASLNRLSRFEPSLKIYPGHGKTSTIGEELLHNAEWKAALQEGNDENQN
jgi:hydroxyacylglutathione hydrolase